MDVESFVKEKIDWLGHASFRINGSKSIVYIDTVETEKKLHSSRCYMYNTQPLRPSLRRRRGTHSKTVYRYHRTI